jgi:hypothetical protein
MHVITVGSSCTIPHHGLADTVTLRDLLGDAESSLGDFKSSLGDAKCFGE